MKALSWWRAALKRRRLSNALPGSTTVITVFRRRRRWLPGVWS